MKLLVLIIAYLALAVPAQLLAGPTGLLVLFAISALVYHYWIRRPEQTGRSPEGTSGSSGT